MKFFNGAPKPWLPCRVPKTLKFVILLISIHRLLDCKHFSSFVDDSFQYIKFCSKLALERRERRNVDPGRISMIEMPVRPTLDIMSTGHSISGAGLLTPLGVGTMGARVTKLAMYYGVCGGIIALCVGC